MNWYLWFVVACNCLAALVYYYHAANGKSIEYKNDKPIGMLLWALLGTILLFWTTGPLNIFGILYVAYTAFTTVVGFTLAHKKLVIVPWVSLLFGLICTMWPVLIFTMGFSL